MTAAFILVITLALGCERIEPTNRILVLDALYLYRMDQSGEVAFSIYTTEDRISALAALRVLPENLPDLTESEVIWGQVVLQHINHYNIVMR